MKDEQFEKMLTGMEVPQAANSAHQQDLKSVLVDIFYTEMKTREKGFFTMRRKIFASVAVGLAGLIAIAVSIVILTPGGQASAAQLLAKQSSSYVSGFSPGGKAQLLQKFSAEYHADPQQLLREAQQASDLTMLTYDQLKTAHADIFAMLPNNRRPAGAVVRASCKDAQAGVSGPVTSGNKTQPLSGDKAQVPVHCGQPQAGPAPAFPDLSNMKFLLFTGSQGQKVLLGIGPDNDPVLTMTIDGVGAVNGAVSAPNEGEAWGQAMAKPPANAGAGTGERCSKVGDASVQCGSVSGARP